LTAKRRQQLIDALDIAPQTLSRWRKFWRETFPQSRCWQAQKGCFIPPVAVTDLPGARLRFAIIGPLFDWLTDLVDAIWQHYESVILDPIMRELNTPPDDGAKLPLDPDDDIPF
jgi:hypothetical protein